MHRDYVVAILTLDAYNGSLVDSEILNKVHAPFEYVNKKAFSSWWERRAIPSHQKNQAVMGEGIGCLCENFTTQDLEFIPAYDVTYFDKRQNDISILQHYIDVCESLGIPSVVMQHSIDYTIMSDFYSPIQIGIY